MSDSFVWTDASVRTALGMPPDAGGRDTRFSQVSTDTRTLEEGALFVAIEGERFDGHAFLGEAENRGAGACVVSTTARSHPSDSGEASTGVGTLRCYEVEDTLVALGLLARFRRRALAPKVVGITGSSGKTTLKELLAASLGNAFRVHATRGNRNNRIGLPLTLLEAPEDTNLWVVELGTSEPGEIGTLAAIAEPDAAVVTTVSEAHLSGLESLEGVLDEKLDLLRGTHRDGPVVVGDRPAILPERAREVRTDVRVSGLSNRADPELRGELLDSDSRGCYRVRWGGGQWRPGLPGRHGVENFLLALSVVRLLGVDVEVAAHAAARVEPGPLRGEVRRVGDLTLLLDCYNANPQSVRAAVQLLSELPGSGRKVTILGSMLELGARSEALHREILEEAIHQPLALVVAVGEFVPAAEALVAGPAGRSRPDWPPTLLAADTAEEAYDLLRPRLSGSETILLKASRGLALEKLLDRFLEDFGASGGAPPGREA